MDKKTHDVIQQYNKMVATLYFELDELGIKSEKLDKLLSKFDSFYDETYKICKSEDKEKTINKEAVLIKQYEEWSSYLRLLVIYKYDNGFSLCETTAGNICLIPNDLISYDVEERGGWQRD